MVVQEILGVESFLYEKLNEMSTKVDNKRETTKKNVKFELSSDLLVCNMNDQIVQCEDK